jgi:hypothetical protein
MIFLCPDQISFRLSSFFFVFLVFFFFCLEKLAKNADYKTSTFHHLSAWRLQFQRITTLMTEKARMLRKRRKGNKEKSSSDEGKSNSGSGGSGSTGSDSKNMLDIDSLGDEEIDNDKRMICHVDMVRRSFLHKHCLLLR